MVYESPTCITCGADSQNPFCSNTCADEAAKWAGLCKVMEQTTKKLLVRVCDAGHINAGYRLPITFYTSSSDGRRRKGARVCSLVVDAFTGTAPCGQVVNQLLVTPEQGDILDAACRLGGHVGGYAYLVDVGLWLTRTHY